VPGGMTSGSAGWVRVVMRTAVVLL
jgi:hypothetical protein